MNTQKESKEQIILNAFNDCLKIVLNGINFNKSKNDYISELALYSLQLKKLFNRSDVFKTLLIDSHLYQLKAYYESLGLFFNPIKDSKGKINFLKVVIDVDGLFNTTKDVEGLPTFKDFLKEQKEQKEQIQIDYNKRLTTLFKKLKKEQIEQLLKDFLKTVKQ